jgi:hypothetical protein
VFGSTLELNMGQGTFFLDHLNFKDRYKTKYGLALTVIIDNIAVIANYKNGQDRNDGRRTR